MKVGILGNGSVGGRLAALFSDAGHHVVVGARAPGAASASLDRAAGHGDVVVLAVPYLACEQALPPLRAALAGKVVVDATNPLAADWSPVLLGQEDSAGERIARLLPDSRVVKAFNTLFADCMVPERLVRAGIRTTAFLCGDHPDANRVVAELAGQVGLDPVDAGPLRCARYLEAMAHLNIHLAVAMGGGTNAVFLYHRGEP